MSAKIFATAACAAAFLVCGPSARAQDMPYAPQQVQGPPPPNTAVAPNGEYVAPIQQQTQQIYVPQSVAMSGPREIRDWSEGDPIPPGYHPTTSIRRGLVIAGAVTFGAVYLLNVLTAAASLDACKAYSSVTNSTCTDASMLFIPVVGPFIQVTRTSGSASLSTLLVIDGIAEAAGVFMFVAGLAWQRTSLIRNDLGRNTPAKPTIAPYFSGAGGGLVGTF